MRTCGQGILRSPGDRILITGAAGFIGGYVAERLLRLGYSNLFCLARPTSDCRRLLRLQREFPDAQIRIVTGNLLSGSDVAEAVRGAKVVYHLATGRGKSFPGVFQNCVVATRNLLDACIYEGTINRFVNVSTFAVYSNFSLARNTVLDETCELENNLRERYDAYVYAKLKQDQLVAAYSQRTGLPYVTVRPAVVFGPGRLGIPNPVGLGTFGIFLHIGAGNLLPLTYVENCADAIVQAGLVEGVEKEDFIIVDDDLPTSREFWRRYKAEVGARATLSVPYSAFYLFCAMWERYARYSKGQLPPFFNTRFCAFNWKSHRFSNKKLKQLLNWRPLVSMAKALDVYFAYQKEFTAKC
jgi:nucleoside-diphosphate-sugar epimerase